MKNSENKYYSAEELQNAIGSFVKSGERKPIKNTKEHGFLKYRELIFNNISGAMNVAFPISKSIVPAKEWEEMLQSFFTNHKAQTNFVWELPKEFVNYCKLQDYDKSLNLPFLIDLLSFEWMEIEIFNMKDKIFPDFVSDGNIETDILIVNPEHKFQIYDYPVHKIDIDNPQLEKTKSFIVSYRHSESKDAEFVALSLLDALIFEKITENKLSVNDAINSIADELKQEIPEELKKASVQFFSRLLENNLFLGFK